MKYYVGAHAHDGSMIWLRAKRDKAAGPIPRACFATAEEAQAQADKRTAGSKNAFGSNFHQHEIFEVSDRQPLRPAFDE